MSSQERYSQERLRHVLGRISVVKYNRGYLAYVPGGEKYDLVFEVYRPDAYDARMDFTRMIQDAWKRRHK